VALPGISVVLPTYNRRGMLQRAVASVLAQDEPQWELIVVDDASTDDTRAYLATLTDPRIRTIALARNGGVSAARNRGLEAARGEIVAFLDSDDVYLQRRLSLPLRIFAEEPEVVCTLSSLLKRFGGGREVTTLMPDVTLTPVAFEWGLVCRLISCSGTNTTVRRADALAVGGFNPQLTQGEDTEFVMRLSRRGSARLISDVLWEKHWSSDALSNVWQDAAKALIAYSDAQPDYVTRNQKLGCYFATQILVADLRHGAPLAFFRDWLAFKRAGLIKGNVAAIWRSHQEVKRYRRRASSPEGLATLTGPPDHW
jgi:glycosyltransferase involved in cell wall biosynthesis